MTEQSDTKPTFPDELFVIEDDVECATHCGHAELVEIVTQLSTHERGFVQRYRKVGVPMEVDMEGRKQHRVVDVNGKALTPWITWEDNDND